MRKVLCVPFVLFILFALPGCIPELTPAEKVEVAAIQARSEAAVNTMNEVAAEIRSIGLAVKALVNAVQAGQVPAVEGKKLIDELEARVPVLEAKFKSAANEIKLAREDMDELQAQLSARGASEFGSVVASGVEAIKTGSPVGALVTIGIAIWQAILRKRAQAAKAKAEAGFGVVSRGIGNISGTPTAASIKAELASEDTEITRAELDALVARALAGAI